jgi:hypothetical protein
MPDADFRNFKVGGGASASWMDPIVFAMLLIAILLMWLLPRKYVVVPFLLVVFLTPFGQQLYVSGLHLFAYRLLIMCGWIRLLFNKISSKTEIASGEFNSIDKVFLLWGVFRASATFLEFLDTPALVNQCAFLIDSLGGYFLLRSLIRDEEDIARVVSTFAVIVSVFALTMTNERLAGLNLFGYLGGRFSPFIRDGVIRSQGTFLGPIPAGTFGASLFCLFSWLWWSGRSRVMGIVGMIGSVVMVVTSASSTPVLGVLAGILAIALWPLRRNMRAVRWTIVIVLVLVHLVMKAPVWMLIARVDLVGGSSGYHRAALIDNCIRHFSDWWLIGVQSTAYWGFEMWDQANQFVAEAAGGGLATLVCFVLMVSRSFGRLGTARRLARHHREREWMFWLLGSTLFSYVVSFFGISFNDQSSYAWFALLAIICAATAPILARETIEEEQLATIPNAVPQLAYWSPSAAVNGKSEESVTKISFQPTSGQEEF